MENLPYLVYAPFFNEEQGQWEVGIVQQGQSGVFSTRYELYRDNEADAQELADELNKPIASTEQVRAMIHGSMFGWDSEGAQVR